MRRLPAGSGPAVLTAVLPIVLGGCERACCGAMEKLGRRKRDIMVDRVESARNAQQEAKEQYESREADAFISSMATQQ